MGLFRHEKREERRKEEVKQENPNTQTVNNPTVTIVNNPQSEPQVGQCFRNPATGERQKFDEKGNLVPCETKLTKKQKTK